MLNQDRWRATFDRTGGKNFREDVLEQVGSDFFEARTWKELLRVLSKYGLTIEKRREGADIRSDTLRVKMEELHQDLSFEAFKERFPDRFSEPKEAWEVDEDVDKAVEVEGDEADVRLSTFLEYRGETVYAVEDPGHPNVAVSWFTYTRSEEKVLEESFDIREYGRGSRFQETYDLEIPVQGYGKADTSKEIFEWLEDQHKELLRRMIDIAKEEG